MFIPQINVGRYSSEFVILPTFVKCLLTSCQCEKYFTSTVPVLFICSRYISLQVTVFVLSTRIFLFLCHFHHLNYRLFMRLQWPPYRRKTYFLVTNWYQLGDTWNFLLIHREILHCVSDSTCIIVLHKSSRMSAIPPHKVNIHKTTKFATTKKLTWHYIVHYGLFDFLCNTEISFQLFKQPVYLGLLFFIGLL